MISPFGVDHGDEVSKGLPSSVKSGGGGRHGSMLRLKNQAGKNAAKFKSVGRESGANLQIGAGKQLKAVTDDAIFRSRIDQDMAGKGARRMRRELLNEDIGRRQRGWKSGKTSALDRGYRGRVHSKMTPLP